MAGMHDEQRTPAPDPSDKASQPTEHEPAGEAISLDRLTNAFAEMLGEREQIPDETDSAGEEATSPSGEEVADEAICEVSPATILEAMLFVGRPDNQALGGQEAADLMRGVEPEEIDGLVDELNRRYAEDGRPYEIVRNSSGYRMQLRPQYHRVRDKFHGKLREITLSQAAVDVLALVGYEQPVTSEEVSHQRGTSSGAILSQLVRRQLLRLERPKNNPRTPRYYTTDRFLKLFGLSTLDDLPRSQDLDKQ